MKPIPESIGLKADCLTDSQLGGAMVWDLSNDDGSLLSTLHYRFLAWQIRGVGVAPAGSSDGT